MKKRILLPVLLLMFVSQSIAQNQNALAFDGVDDYVQVPGASSLISGSSQLSLTCWVYPTNAAPAFPDFDGFAGIRNDLDADFYILQLTSNNVEARLTNSSGTVYTITSQGLALNTWQHFALTYDGSWLRLARNGVVSDSIAASGSISNTGVDFLMGSVYYLGTNYYLSGKLDEVSLWNIALSPEDIRCIYLNEVDSLAPGLQLYYKFNQGVAGANNSTQTSLHDASGHINGTLLFFALTNVLSNFVAGVSNYTFVSDSICNGDSYTFGSTLLSNTGIYYDVLTSSLGCDSTVELTLTVQSPDTTVLQAWVSLTALQQNATYQWLDCTNGYAPINGETDSIFYPVANGSYAVAVTQNGCTDTSSCHVMTFVGIPETETMASFIIQTNPFQEILAVSSMVPLKNISLSLKDIHGKEYLHQKYEIFKNEAWEVKQLPAGIYILQIDSGNKFQYLKVVKQ